MNHSNTRTEEPNGMQHGMQPVGEIIANHLRCVHCNVPILATGNAHAPFLHAITHLEYCGIAVDREYEKAFRQIARPNISLLTRQTFYELTPAMERQMESNY